MLKIHYCIIVLFLFIMPLALAELKVSNETASWKSVKISGTERNLLLVVSNLKDKKADFCWYYPIGYTPNATETAVKSLYYLNGTCIKDDKNKCIVGIKYETAKCNVNGNMRNGFHLSLTDAQAVNINDNFKLGNSTFVEIYQNETKVIYDEDTFETNATLYKWNGQAYVLSPQDIFVNNTNPARLKFGAIDYVPLNITNNSLNDYQYVWDSNKEILFDGTRYYQIADTINYFLYPYTELRIIDTSDICKTYSSCNFKLRNDGLQLNLTFKALNNDGAVYIDPTYVETYSSSSLLYQANFTEVSIYGVRLLTSVLSMDFNTPDNIVTDGTIYNNVGTLQ